jgi:hypothetical protein
MLEKQTHSKQQQQQKENAHKKRKENIGIVVYLD